MSASNPSQELLQLRNRLEPLVDRFELDDPDRGLVAVVTVVGGVFIHPLTRKPIQALKIYGAGPDRVKIAEPPFLRSLPRIPIEGLIHPAQFCALVAKTLSEFLEAMGKIRDKLSAMGISMELEYHVLRLLGRVELQGLRIKVTASRPGVLIVTTVGENELSGSLPREQRTLILKNEPTGDLDQLARLVASLNQQLKRNTLESMEQSMGIMEPETAKRDVSGVFELTETIEDDEPTAELPVAPAGPAAPEHPQEKPLGTIGLRKLLDRLGFDAEITAYGNRLRLMVPLKVVQGEYVFYLEQRGPTRFVGVLHSPAGTRHPVEFDLKEIMDIKEVFDRVVMGKNGSE